MSDFILLILILVLVVCIILTVAAFVLYSGLLSEVVIKTGPPPIKNVTIAYKFKEGPYKDCGAAYTESCSIGPKLSNIAIFYDDPKQKPADQCRYIVGSVLSEGEEKPDEELQKLYEKFGFKVFSLPEVSHAVTSSFPCTSPMSHVVAPNRVYPQLGAYIQERKLSAFPYIEICSSDSIHYMVPLSRQTDFFVPEVKEEPRTDVKEEDSDEDRGTDITGNRRRTNRTTKKWYAADKTGLRRRDDLQRLLPVWSWSCDFRVCFYLDYLTCGLDYTDNRTKTQLKQDQYITNSNRTDCIGLWYFYECHKYHSLYQGCQNQILIGTKTSINT
uniref:Uncharacterized protein n=1 Tax=Periophthalmus magnuspinnatus TaxID=409849 RepID=A0A3B3ZNT9_9GOBI